MRIDDLRDTLHEHADLSHDGGLTGRADAVRGRVRAVRRRRAGVVAGCAALAVLAVPALAALETDVPEPAGRSLAGRTAPETMVATGFTYEFERAVEGPAAQPLELRLRPESTPRLVSWTVNAGEAEGRLVDRRSGEPYADDWVGGGDGFETYEYVPAGASADLRLSPVGGGDAIGEGEMALAVYTLGDELPQGVAGQGVVFRDQVAGAELLGAAIGQPGESTVSFDVIVPEHGLRLSEVCTAPTSFWVHVSIDGRRGYTGSSCSGERDLDAAGGGWLGIDPRTAPAARDAAGSVAVEVGDTVRVRASIHPHSRSSRPVSVADAFLGLGVYAAPTEVRVGTTETTLFPVIEQDGHTWNLVEVQESTPGDQRFEVEVGPAERTTYVELGAANDPAKQGPDGPEPGGPEGQELRWSTRLAGESVGRSYSGASGTYGPATEVRLAEGERLPVEMQALTGPDEDLVFYAATYELAD